MPDVPLGPTEREFIDPVAEYLGLMSQVGAIEARYAELRARAAQSSGSLALNATLDAYGSTMQALDTRVGELGTDPDVQAFIVREAQTARETLATDIPLLQTVLPETDLLQLRQNAEGTLQFAAAFAVRHNVNIEGIAPVAEPAEPAVVPALASVPASVEPAAAPEPTRVPASEPTVRFAEGGEATSKHPVTLFVETTDEGPIVRIGDGRSIKATAARGGYAELRLRALRYLSSRQEKGDIPSQELEHELGLVAGEAGPTMLHVRTWLTRELTYHGHPLFVHNRKRGTSSAYSVNPAFFITIAEGAVTPDNTSPAETPRPPAGEQTEPYEPPFTFRHAILLASFLRTKQELLAQLQIPLSFDDDWYDELLEASRRQDEQMGINCRAVTDKELAAERRVVADEFRRLFSPEARDTLEDIYLLTPNDDPRGGFMEALMDIDNDTQWQAIGNILAGLIDDDVTFEVVRSGPNRGANFTLVSVTHGQQNARDRLPLDYLLETDLSAELPGTRAAVEALPAPPELREELQDALDSVVKTYLAPGQQRRSLAPLSASIHALRQFFPWLEPRTVRGAKESGIIRLSGQHVVLGPEEMSRIALWKRNPNDYGLRKNRSTIDAAIARAVEQIETTRDKANGKQ